MNKLRTVALLLLAYALLLTPAAAGERSPLERVAEASASFVDDFNTSDAEALGSYYTRNGMLKLPGAFAVAGRDDVVDAWQAGFDAGLDFLVLSVESLEVVGERRVLENGTYALTIQTPDGTIVQEGTFSVLWRVPDDDDRRPRIVFDAIDAN